MRLINIPLLRKNVLNNMVKPVSAMGAYRTTINTPISGIVQGLARLREFDR